MKFKNLEHVTDEPHPDNAAENDRLEHIHEWLQTRLRPADSSAEGWVDESLNFCLDLIEELKNENESLWLMLEELKASEMESWAKDNEGMLQEYLDEQVKKLKWHNKFKGEA